MSKSFDFVALRNMVADVRRKRAENEYYGTPPAFIDLAEDMLDELERKNAVVAAGAAMAQSVHEYLEGKYGYSECWLDHNGFCQEHACGEPCMVAEMIAALDRWDEVA